MSEWGISLGKEFKNIWGNIKRLDAKASEGVTVPMAAYTEGTTNTPWAKMLGVEVGSTQPYFTEDELTAFVSENAPNVTPFVAETATEAIEGADEDAFYVFENVVPDETTSEYYAVHHVDGTAERTYKMGIASDDMADITEGDASLLDVSALLFRDAQYQRESA